MRPLTPGAKMDAHLPLRLHILGIKLCRKPLFSITGSD